MIRCMIKTWMDIELIKNIKIKQLIMQMHFYNSILLLKCSTVVYSSKYSKYVRVYM